MYNRYPGFSHDTILLILKKNTHYPKHLLHSKCNHSQALGDHKGNNASKTNLLRSFAITCLC